MQLNITDSASRWFATHYRLNTGNGIKIFGKTVQPRHVQHTPDQGFAVEDRLDDAALNILKDGINYHINFTDEWFFSGLVTTIDYSPEDDHPTFSFKKELPASSKENPYLTTPDATTTASQRFEGYWE